MADTAWRGEYEAMSIVVRDVIGDEAGDGCRISSDAAGDGVRHGKAG
jgi:hypothetical protein